MKTIAWHQVFSNYHNLSFQPNGKTEVIGIKQNTGGKKLAVELSNEYDSVPLQVKKVRISLNEDLRNPVDLTRSGEKEFVIPPHGYLWTDEVSIEIPTGSDLFFEIEVGNQRNRLASSANLYSKEIVTTNCQSENTFIYGLTSVAIETKGSTKTIGFFGDSLTNQAYFSDRVLNNFRQSEGMVTGFNAGISGNRLLLPGTAASQWKDSFGEAGIDRFQKDVLKYQPDIVLGLIGINDLFHPGTGSPIAELPSPEQMIAGYRSLYEKAAACNIPYIAMTLPPFANSSNQEKPAWNPEKEAIREAVNHWLLQQPNTIDIASFVADPSCTYKLNETFDCGDHLHFSASGGQQIGDYVYQKVSRLVV
ncbi:GDSL-type esterase/lipase family protein [Enterococcus sp. AZ109]|uniref:GDSL-type esterase/lipase family protein n=1 Tax=Enterococcus sp. AZ109 TaxID=2774634 RepID=UPI003F27715D